MSIDEICEGVNSSVKLIQELGSDQNQNTIKTDVYSYERLCSIIEDLENESAKSSESGDDQNSPETGENDCQKKYNEQITPEKDLTKSANFAKNSTYEDIISFLQQLEEDSVNGECNNDSTLISSDNYLNSGGAVVSNQCYVNFISALKDEIATAKLQLEEKDAIIGVLKEELRNERKKSCDQLAILKRENDANVDKQKAQNQATVKRHQKFIEKLLSEKKELTEKCNELALSIKDMEIQHQRQMKICVDRHAIELQKTKDMCAASEKVRRNRWVEAKTSKIKEMTVRGLEPELRSMIEQHQKEVQEIRSLHSKELQDLELRTIRQANLQLEQLRAELTSNYEKIIATENSTLYTRYQEKLAEQEKFYKMEQEKNMQRHNEEKETILKEQTRRDADHEAILEQNRAEYEEKIRALSLKHEADKRELQETLQLEQKALMDNYKRQINAKFKEAEIKIKEQCDRERNQQMELAISEIEKETNAVKISIQNMCDNKIRSLTTKYEAEILNSKELNENLENKLNLLQDVLSNNNSKLNHCENELKQNVEELTFARKTIETLTDERDNAKKIARDEIEKEKRDLEEKISSLYKEIAENNMNRDVFITQLHSRIKLIVTQKNLTIKKLNNEIATMTAKHEHLEKLLNQQRKEYVLNKV